MIACQSLMPNANAMPQLQCQLFPAWAMGHGPWGDVPQGTHLSALYVFLNTVFCTNTVIQKSRVGGVLAISDIARQRLRPRPWTDESTTDNTFRNCMTVQ